MSLWVWLLNVKNTACMRSNGPCKHNICPKSVAIRALDGIKAERKKVEKLREALENIASMELGDPVKGTAAWIEPAIFRAYQALKELDE